MIISLASHNTFSENLICFICQSFNHNLNPSNLYYLCSAVITHQQRQATAKAKPKPEFGVLGHFLWNGGCCGQYYLCQTGARKNAGMHLLKFTKYKTTWGLVTQLFMPTLDFCYLLVWLSKLYWIYVWVTFC